MVVLNRAIKLVHALKDNHQVEMIQQNDIEYCKNYKIELEQLLHEIKSMTQG